MRATHLARSWARRLTDAGIDTALLDAELLVANASGIPRERLLIDDRDLTPDELATAEALLARRTEERVPVAYLIGERWFDGLKLEVSPGVLVPRPETEQLVELAARYAPEGARVIDVGTGSGAVAIALAVRRPDLEITASDIDPAALAVAQANAERHGVLAAGEAAGGVPACAGPGSPGVRIAEADLLGSWEGEVVVSNPPYVEDAWRDEAAPELAHEPPHALYAGADGLDAIRRLVAQCAGRGVGLVLLEHGHQQGAAIRALLTESGYADPQTEQDLAGHDRITWTTRAS